MSVKVNQSLKKKFMEMVAAVVQTPGYSAIQDGGDVWRFTRKAFEESTPETSVHIKVPADPQGLRDVARRLRKIKWSESLFTDLHEIARKATEAQWDDDKLNTELNNRLRLAFTGSAAPPTEHDAERHKRRTVVRERLRHGHAPAAGSAPARKTEAVPDTAPAVPAQNIVESDIVTTVEFVSPELAERWTARENVATYQRAYRENTSLAYAEMMERGDWVHQPADPLCFDTDGKLCNGRHRLAAVALSERGQVFSIARNVPKDAFHTMDHGLRRTGADDLHGRGLENSQQLAPVLNLLHLWFNVPRSEWHVAPKPTNAQRFEMYESCEGIDASIRSGLLGIKGVSTSASRVAHYLCAQVCNGETGLVTNWYKDIKNDRYESGSPGRTLYNYFNATKERGVVGIELQRLHLYLILTAWNKTAQGHTWANPSRSVVWEIPNPIPPTPKALFLTHPAG